MFRALFLTVDDFFILCVDSVFGGDGTRSAVPPSGLQLPQVDAMDADILRFLHL